MESKRGLFMTPTVVKHGTGVLTFNKAGDKYRHQKFYL